MIFAILATFLYTIREAYSKKIMINKLDNYSLLLAMRFYGIFFLIIIAFFLNESIFVSSVFVDFKITLLILGSIIVGASGMITLYDVLAKVELGSFAIIATLAPVITVILGYFILGEQLAFLVYLGIFTTVVGVGFFLYVENKNKHKENISKKLIVKLIIAYTLLVFSNILFKSISDIVSPIQYAFLLMIGSVVFLSSVILVKKRDIRAVIRPIKINKDILIVSLVATLSTVLIFNAFKETSPSIVNTVTQLKIFMTVIVGFIIFKERGMLKYKLTAAVLSFLGVILIVGVF